MTPDEIADIEAGLMYGEDTGVTRRQALDIIGAYKHLAAQYRQAVIQGEHGLRFIEAIRTMAGDPTRGLPPEWAMPWRLRAEQAENGLARAGERLALIVATCKKGWDEKRGHHQERHRLRGFDQDHMVATAYARAMDDLDKAVAAHWIEQA